jgi:hypothetical protein
MDSQGGGKMIGAIALRTPTIRDRASRVAAQFALYVIGLVVAAFAVTVVYPWNPVTKVAIRVLNQPTTTGPIVVEIDYCKARAWVPELVRWSLVNDITIVLPTTTMSMPVGCHVKSLMVPTPIHLIPGNYRLKEELFYRPWPWRSIVYEIESTGFTVTQAKE